VVSIRAPRTRAGRRLVSSLLPPPMPCFNPRPAHARGATWTVRLTPPRPCPFQSAPRARARGDRTRTQELLAKLVSIRAPRTRAGRRLVHLDSPHQSAKFQSAPRARARGDSSLMSLVKSRPSFNPRPAHARGATLNGERRKRIHRSFNPRPAHARGATCGLAEIQRTDDVSIRAPRTRAGRQRRNWFLKLVFMFQSAPRARARGDIFASERARYQKKFQSAPRARARGDRFGLV